MSTEEEMAIAAAESAVKEQPNDPELLRQLGWAYFEARRFNDAIVAARRALELRPNDARSYQLIGRAYLDEVNDPWIELVLNVHGGVTRTQFENTFEWWESSVGEFEDEIGV